MRVRESIKLSKNLREQILTKFRGDSQGTVALETMEIASSEIVLEKAIKYLEIVMEKEAKPVDKLRKPTRRTINIKDQNRAGLKQNSINYTRDLSGTNQAQGYIQIGGA